jgi:hypothetical protein
LRVIGWQGPSCNFLNLRKLPGNFAIFAGHWLEGI